MAYRVPRYSHVHAARDVGAAGISLDGDSAHADFPIDNLIDDRAGTIFKFSASVVNPNIEIDLGASFAADGLSGLSRLIIPRNHNIEEIGVFDDDAADFVGKTTLHATDSSVVAGQQIDIEFDTANSTQRFIQLAIVGTAQFFLPQIFLTKIIFDSPTSPGPTLQRSPDGKRANFARQNQPTGQSPTVQLGPQQRLIEYDYENPLEGADLTAMEALVDSVGMDRPFYVDPASFSTPPETDEPVLWMKFEEMPSPNYSVLVPMSGTRSKNYTLRLIESLD